MSFVVQLRDIPVVFCGLHSRPGSISNNEQLSVALSVNICIQKGLVACCRTCGLTKTLREWGLFLWEIYIKKKITPLI